MSERPVYQIDRDALPFVTACESNGLIVDVEAMTRLTSEMEQERDRQLEVLRSIVGDPEFNPGSTRQVGNHVQELLPDESLPLTKTGQVCTNKKVLARYRDRVPEFTEALTIYRHIRDKILGTYLNPLPGYLVGSKLYPKINYTGPVSGRLADRKSYYGMLTMPVRSAYGKRLRGLFGPEPGTQIGSWDLSQIELRIAAHVSQDPILVKLFRDGKDLHADTMEAFGVPRIVAKTINFRVLYAGPDGKGAGMADQLLMAGVKGYTARDCDKLIAAWFERYGGVNDAIRVTAANARTLGYVEDMWGRRRYVPELRFPRGVSRSLDKVAEEAARQAFNLLIQAAVSGLMKRAEKRITDSELFRSRRLQPLLQIHDELIVQFRRKDRAAVDKFMRWALLADAPMFSVPIECSGAWGANWGELK